MGVSKAHTLLCVRRRYIPRAAWFQNTGLSILHLCWEMHRDVSTLDLCGIFNKIPPVFNPKLLHFIKIKLLDQMTISPTSRLHDLDPITHNNISQSITKYNNRRIWQFIISWSYYSLFHIIKKCWKAFHTFTLLFLDAEFSWLWKNPFHLFTVWALSHFSFELWCWHTIWDLFLGSWLAERHLSKQNAFTILLLIKQTECLDRSISYLSDATKKEKKLPQLPDAVVKLFQCDHCLQLWVGHDTHSQAESNVQMINPNTE